MAISPPETFNSSDSEANKISAAGCGITNLDSHFGVMTHTILAILRKGHSFESGKALYYAPDRSISHQVGKGDYGK